jgi:SAM-dependent methyltransferase
MRKTETRDVDTDTATAADAESAVRRVREEYSRIAERGALEDGATGCCDETGNCSERIGYDAADVGSLPEGADMGLGCGAPVPLLELEAGETVLDLGSGGGIDVFLAARQVGPTGRVIGVDMTPRMIEVARENAARAATATSSSARAGWRLYPSTTPRPTR